MFRNASESVVSIQTLALRRNMFSFDVMQIPAGAGSGFVWDRKGHIVTNFHVIEEGNAFQVTLADQSAWEAQVVGTAPYKDLAVLRIDAPADRLNAPKPSVEVPLPLKATVEAPLAAVKLPVTSVVELPTNASVPPCNETAELLMRSLLFVALLSSCSVPPPRIA